MYSGEGYHIRENTGDPEHPPIDAVISLALNRAAEPRPLDHPNGHFDQYIKDAVDRFGEDDVVHCIRLTLTEDHTHRMAGTVAFGESDYVWGINVGVAAIGYLREILQEQSSDNSL